MSSRREGVSSIWSISFAPPHQQGPVGKRHIPSQNGPRALPLACITCGASALPSRALGPEDIGIKRSTQLFPRGAPIPPPQLLPHFWGPHRHFCKGRVLVMCSMRCLLFLLPVCVFCQLYANQAGSCKQEKWESFVLLIAWNCPDRPLLNTVSFWEIGHCVENGKGNLL